MKAALTLLTLATVAISSTQAVAYDQTVSNTIIIEIPQLS
jgi:putative cell wall-binding protein